MKLPDRYVALRNVGLLQRQAGVDPQVAELVKSFARLRLDAGEEVTYEFGEFSASSIEARLYRRLVAVNGENVDLRFLRFMATYGASFTRRGLPVIYSAEHLARHLALAPHDLFRLSAQPSRHYREFRVPKARGGERRLLSPQGTLRRVQGWLLHRMLNRCEPHQAAQAFTRGRSIATNARVHEHRKVVVSLDLEEFFPSVRAGAVRRVFERLGYPYSVASLLAALCTVDGGLPQGAPTSPALSNLVNVRLDRRFAALGARLGFSYTRYADDLVMSSDDERLPALLPFFREVIRSEGYRVNEAKTRVMRSGTAQEVTGLVTNLRAGLKRHHRRLLRAMVHRLRTQGPSTLVASSRRGSTSGDPVRVLRGHLAFLNMVEPDRAAQLVRQLPRHI
jgi:retron-type reverse transcriptase